MQQSGKLTAINKNALLVLVVCMAAIVAGAVVVAYDEIFIWGAKIARERFVNNSSLIFIIVPAAFLFSAWLCRRFAPNAAGGGTDHVVSALQKIGNSGKGLADVSEYLSFRVIIVKIISSVVCVAGGGALGREGPAVQICAGVFAIVAQKTKKILPHFDLRTWIIAGSAAGLAAAFNTPIAGIIFAIEELSQFHLEKQFSGFKTKAFFAVIIAGVTAQLMTGSYVLFEFPLVHFIWQVEIAFMLVMVAVLCGLAAFMFRWAMEKIVEVRERISGILWYLFPLISGVIVALVSYYAGENSFGPGVVTVQNSLQSSVASLGLQDFASRFTNSVASMASGSAGGVLLPALALGAAIGSMSSHFMPIVDSRVFIASGMAAFLGAFLNAPLTAAVLVLEVTNQRELVFPLFLATILASWVCNNWLRGVRG